MQEKEYPWEVQYQFNLFGLFDDLSGEEQIAEKVKGRSGDKQPSRPCEKEGTGACENQEEQENEGYKMAAQHRAANLQ
jgi:hypothetical protein